MNEADDHDLSRVSWAAIIGKPDLVRTHPGSRLNCRDNLGMPLL